MILSTPYGQTGTLAPAILIWVAVVVTLVCGALAVLGNRACRVAL